MSAHARVPYLPRHRRRPTRRAPLLRLGGIATLAAVVLLACTVPSSPAPAPETSAPQSLRLGTSPKAPKSMQDPARAPYGSGAHGGWLDKPYSASTPEQFQKVVDENGILILGDSIARQTSNEYAQRMWDQHELPTAVFNWPGRPTAPVADWVEEFHRRIPDRGIVIASGSNDIFYPKYWWKQVQRVLDVADGRPVYWVSVYVDRWGSSDPDQRVADLRNSAWINQQLYAMQVHNPNLIVVDWFAYLSQGYNEANVAGWLTDGVHPTTAGIDAWSDLLELRMGL
jgi:hypothetical protein